MPTYTYDQLAHHLEQRGATVTTTPNTPTVVEATYDGVTVYAFFDDPDSRFSWAVTAPQDGADVGSDLYTLKDVISVLDLPTLPLEAAA